MKLLHPLEWFLLFAAPLIIAGCFKLCVEKNGTMPPEVSGSVTVPANIQVNTTQPNH